MFIITLFYQKSPIIQILIKQDNHNKYSFPLQTIILPNNISLIFSNCNLILSK